MPKSSFADHMKPWNHLATTLAGRLDTHPHLRPQWEILSAALEEARSAKERQLALRAAAQQASRDLDAAMAKASESAVRLHLGLRSVYGRKSATLLEFGMRPHPAAGLSPDRGAPAADAGPPPPGGEPVRPDGGSVPPSGPEAHPGSPPAPPLSPASARNRGSAAPAAAEPRPPGGSVPLSGRPVPRQAILPPWIPAPPPSS